MILTPEKVWLGLRTPKRVGASRRFVQIKFSEEAEGLPRFGHWLNQPFQPPPALEGLHDG